MALANFPGHTTLKIPEDQVRKLQAIAPRYLQRGRKSSGVVIWAIDELLRLKDEEADGRRSARAEKAEKAETN